MGEIAFIVLLALAYPFIAAMMVGAGRNRRLEALEHELVELRQALKALQAATARAVRESVQEAPATPAQPIQPAQTAPPPPPAPRFTAPPAPTFAYRPIDTTQAAAASAVWQPEPKTARPTAAPAVETPRQPAVTTNIDTVPPAVAPAASSTTPIHRPPPPPIPPRWLTAARDWLFTGNLVAKLGLVILFIGVGFLLKYVAATVAVPIELRLAGVVLADLALLGWGWRLRNARRGIGLPVQGAAIAILMLVVFGAYQRYALLPAGFAFSLLVLLTAFTCLLAVLQEAVWLAVFGITGGFAAPLLVSSGQGSHIALFSYYALLNAGVFALAIRRSWRLLNLLGFAFTFVIGAAWGGLRYTPADYASAQGFLLLFFLFYVGIALAFARVQQTRLKDYVDATLVLGTPLLAFGLQAGLVRDKPFGIALSALALGGFYLTLGMWLWRRGRERWRVLVETFATLGVIFGTLAIPFALDGRWTSGAWALEGAGFVWYGLRRGQRRTWLFGMLVQAGAWLSFLGAATGLEREAALQSSLWLGFLLIAGSTFAMALALRRHVERAAGDEAPVLSVLASGCLALAAAWLLAGWWTESILRFSGAALANWLVGGAVLTALLLYLVAGRLAWRLPLALAWGAQLLGAAGLVVASVVGLPWLHGSVGAGELPLAGVLMIALAALATSRMLERAPGRIEKMLAPAFLAWGALWWFGPVIHIAAGRLTGDLPAALGLPGARWLLLYALGVAASVIAAMLLARRLDWARLRWLGAACWIMLAVVTADVLLTLYGERVLPDPAAWLAWLVLLAAGEYLLRQATAVEGARAAATLRALHVLRGAGPWLALWPAGSILVGDWLDGAAAAGGWAVSAAWGNYLPSWAMMLVLAWLLRRARARQWPAQPLSDWYRARLLPCGALLMLLLAAVWNLGQDGAMAPLPYLSLLNPLDLSTGFALLLWAGMMDALAARATDAPRLRVHLRIATMVLAYAWFNLILLRSAAHYLDIAYRIDDLADSQFVQATLSLVWSASALVIMRYAAQWAMRRTWGVGAALLAVVVLKLFVVDLANGGSMARVVSFVGAGLLMLLIGYFAPYPRAGEGGTAADANT